MKKGTFTEENAENSNTGGVLIGKRKGQTIIHNKGSLSGYLVGKTHAEGGIKAINKSTGQPLEMQGGEVVITAPAVADQTKHEFDGEMLTNREILSKINERGGGVSFAKGGDIPSEMYYNGSSYNYGGQTMTDYEIMQKMNDCGCEDDYDNGGEVKTWKQKYNKKYGYPASESHDLEEISKDTGFSLKGLQQIYNKGIGAYKTNPESVRPNVKSKEQWAMARVYSAVMGGKASKIDANELKMNTGGHLSKGKSLKDIAEMHNVSLSHIKDELKKGIEVESEHTSDKKEQTRIAKDHLVENPNYYTILEKVGLEKGGYLSKLSPKSAKLIESNYQRHFGFYDFDWNKESKREDFDSWLNKFENSQFEKNLNHVISLIDEDINLKEKRAEAVKKLEDFEELIIPTLGKDVKNKPLTKYQEMIIMNPDAFDKENLKETEKALSDKGIFNEDGSINKQKVTYSKVFVEEGINLPAFEDFVEKNPEFQGVFNHWKKLLDESFKLSIQSTNAFRYPSLDELKFLKNELSKLQKESYAHGGETKKENLVKDAKDGNTPARDLNNYNDVLDLEADGVFGGLTGLELSDGVGGADASGGVGAFDNGGRIGEETILFAVRKGDPDWKEVLITNNADKIEDAKKWALANGFDRFRVSKIDMMKKPDFTKTFAGGGATLSAEVFEWDKVPTNYRNISKVKKVPFTNNPMDKGLDSIIAPLLGKDELRPVMSGINFDENGITATNAHILITLPYPNQKYEGIYDINRVKKIKADQPILIGGNYANYEAVIPKSNVIEPYEIDVYKLLQYTKTAMNYANKTTRGISYKFGDNDRIGFNGSFLSDVLTASLKLGHEKLYAFITTPNRAMVLSPKKDYELGSDEILLIMPIILDSKFGTINGYGTNDPDYNRSIKAYFDFNDSEIHNADGSVAEFKMQYENNLSVDDKYLALLNKITSKRNRIPILDYAKVEDGKMTATDLEISLIIKDVNIPDGIYEIVNKAPNITMQPIEDFPRERVFNKNESEKHFEFVTFSEVFEFYLDKLLLSVGKDDLRPVMSGICIKKTSDNKLFLVTTDAHTLCKINITEYCQFEKDNRESEYILPTKYLKDFVKLTDGSLHFKCNVSNIFIEADNLEYIARTIDGKYPNYDAIIPRETIKSITFDHVVMNKCMKSPEVSSQLTKYKGNKDIVFTLANEGNNLFLKVQKDKGYNMPFEFLYKIELCEIDFNYKQVNSNFSLNESLFLLMPFKDEFKENQYFSFRKDYFDKMLETITDTEVECYFTEPNRAYIFPIDAIDYKKTLPEEKKKEQKISETEMQKIEEALQLAEAIETLEILLETANRKDKKQIKEALEVLKMLNENN